MATETFLDVARALLEDPDAKAAFGDDSDGYLAARGLDDLSPDDVADAVGFVAEAMPPGVAARLGAGPADDPLGRLAQLEPVSIDEARADLLEDRSDDSTTGEEAGNDEPMSDDGAFAPLDATISDPGFGVGYTDEDLDDISAPEVDDGELPVGFDLPLDEAGLIDAEPELIDPGAHALDAHEGHEQQLHGHDLSEHVDHHVDPHVDPEDPADDGHDDPGHDGLGL